MIGSVAEKAALSTVMTLSISYIIDCAFLKLTLYVTILIL